MARQFEDLGHKQTEIIIHNKYYTLYQVIFNTLLMFKIHYHKMGNLLLRLFKEEIFNLLFNSNISKLKIDDNDSVALYSK